MFQSFIANVSTVFCDAKWCLFAEARQNLDLKYFYMKSAKKLGIPILAFSVLYVLFHYVENIAGSSFKPGYEFDVYQSLVDWLRGEPHTTMWYMYMIIPLYLVTPFLLIIKSSVTEKVWHVLAVFMMVYSVIVSYTCTLSWILQFAQWLGYFMMGDVISGLGDRIVCKGIFRRPCVCVGLSYLLLLGHWYIYTYRSMRLSGPGYLSPFNVAASLMLFVGFTGLTVKPNTGVDLIARNSFYIYLLHPFFCETLMQLFGRVLKMFPAAYFIPVFVFCITMTCVFIVELLKKICRKDMFHMLRVQKGNDE